MHTAEKLADFVAAQDAVYDGVRRELQAGRKRSHWMWFVFPQATGLGHSAMARRFGLDSVDEARQYLAHPTLGPRLRECTDWMLAAPGDAHAILGSPDDLKFCSSMTLFELAAPDEPRFATALDHFYGGQRDARTLQLMGA